MWIFRKGLNRRGSKEELKPGKWKNGILNLWIVLASTVLIWIVVSHHSVIRTELGSLLAERETGQRTETIQRRSMEKQLRLKCGVKTCPDDYFTFRLKSGIANIIGPKICFEGKTIMSGVANNIGRGLNIVLLKGDTGKLIKKATFDMYDGKIEPLVTFLKEIEPNTIVLVASYDEPADILTSEVREMFFKLGSTEMATLAHRDSWVFAGASGIIGKSPYEKRLKNDKASNKYNGWPDLVSLEGCFPKNPDQKEFKMTTQDIS